MDWVERRFAFENNLKIAWENLLTEIECAMKSFDRHYAHPEIAEIHTDRKGWCITIRHTPNKTGTSRSIQICLDEKGKRVFSRVDGAEERDVIYFGFDAAGAALLVDKDSVVLANDRASQLLLEPFLFPNCTQTPQLRFPIVLPSDG
jgi:hypothetical protein